MITFVILHYKNIKDTIECIKSIKELNEQKKINIVIVDNNTLMKKEITTLRKYTKDIILLEQNYGFAKANNIGCNYAIDKYNPDYIYCINNDTIIYQKNLVQLIEESYKKYKFDIQGPKIITNGGNSVNPFPAYEDTEIVEKIIKKNKLLIKIYKNIICAYLLEIFLYIKYKFKKIETLENGKDVQFDVSLHGCALIFSKKYLKKYKFPFYNDTFLYHEEEFLTYRKNKDKLVFVYNPMIEIFHKEGASLDFNIKNNRKKKIFKYTEINKSLELLLSLMKRGNKYEKDKL